MPLERLMVHVEFSTDACPGDRLSPFVAVLFPVFRHRLDLLHS